MNDIFEQEAILDRFFKTFESRAISLANFTKNIINKRITVKNTNISGDVYVGKFFSLLGGSVRFYCDFEAEGSGWSEANSIVSKIKNLDTNETQIVYSTTSGTNKDITLLPCTKYEITVNVGAGTTNPTVYLIQCDLCFDIKTNPEKYIVSQQAKE